MNLVITPDFSAWNALFDRIRENIVPSKALAKAPDIIRADVEEQFHESGRGWWRPLSKMTVMLREARDFPYDYAGNIEGIKPLLDTGQLMESWVEESNVHHFEEFDSTGLSFGSDLSYAAMQQYGNDMVPARPVVLEPSVVERIAEAAAEALKGN